jgi:hypothetical protein
MNKLVEEFTLEEEDLYELIKKFTAFCSLCSRNPKYHLEHRLHVSHPSTITIKLYKNDRTTENS